MKQFILSITFFILLFNAAAQRNMIDSIIPTPLFGVQYGGTWSGGDLKERYGYFNHVGIAGGYKFRKNWYVGLAGDFMFGNNIQLSYYDLFHHLMDSKGNITDQNGDIATVLTFGRGFHVNVEGGKVINKLGHNKNSGLFIKIGAGYLNHRIRIESNDHVVPQVEKEYRKGYDRLTTGFNTTQFIGYLFMGDNSFLNFYAGFYIQEGFTKNRRTIFWDQPDVPVPTNTRFDLMYGFKVGWLIPVYKRTPKAYYFD
ncbi:hypothetical protein H9Y05_09365 [Crocinitomicaceae bacterium CZZ-1]|uniref:Outer membrane protein beta-barrel domain-containing protein n=1 Tax=Taishania pollutisoli TaxID=2766479 RepID=A0A8J6P6B0_9FLAO|nr:hypothetical protein [Taishania pollutisoli]MBC9812679.1 hypothetical protein [Taishania pollutisoli]